MSSKIANIETKKALSDYMERSGKTLKQIGKKLGYSESMVSMYFSENPVGNLDSFEASVRDMLAAEAREEQWGEVYFQTRAVEECTLLFDLIRASRDVGIISSEPGIGKSVASSRYAAGNKTALLCYVTKWSSSRWGVQRLIWDQLDTRKYDKAVESKSDHLVRRMSNSDRLIIMDNAQRIEVSGIQWLLDFHDITNCPIALVGNPDMILERLRSDPAMSSRIGIRKEISTRRDDKDAQAWLSNAADQMIKAMWPEALAEIRTLAHEAVRQPGHLRRLNKQLKIAIRMSESPAWNKSRAAAFAYSRTLLVSDSDQD